MGAMRTTIS